MGIFDGLTGQRPVKEKLVRLFGGGAPGHAHLFLGAGGMGKRSFALAYAKALLCVGSSAGDVPCGACIPCKLFDGGLLDDFMVVEPSGQGQTPVIPVDAARRVKDWFAIRPLYSGKKVCLVIQADHMTDQAQNALLKTLEEPPRYGVMILTAENPGLLLETVRSRCTLTNFTGYTEYELEHILRGAPDCAQGPAAMLYIRLSGGNPGHMLDLARSGVFLSNRDELLGLFCGHLDGDARMSYMLSAFLTANRGDFFLNTGLIIHWLRDLWLCAINGPVLGGGIDSTAAQTEPVRGEDAYQDGYSDESILTAGGLGVINGDMARRLDAFYGRFRPDALLGCIERVDRACAAVSANVNFSLAVNAMLININDTLS